MTLKYLFQEGTCLYKKYVTLYSYSFFHIHSKKAKNDSSMTWRSNDNISEL